MKLFRNNQYGLRLKRSCADATASSTELVVSKIDKNTAGQACSIDPQKAFDIH